MKLGAEPKKALILAGLLLVAAYIFYSNSTSSDVPQSSTPPVRVPQPAASAVPGEAREEAPHGSRESSRLSRQEFRPSLKPRRPEDRLDPATADPTLRLDLLERLRRVKFTGGTRSLFEFSQTPPPPKAPEAKILQKVARKFMGPLPPPPPAPPTPILKPQAPPIPLRFYGYVTAPRGGSRRAFFLEGEDIHVAGEGQLVKKRYKVVRIGVNSVTMEDTQFEGRQTLPLAPEAGG
jgi:hypothetical protein